MRLWRTLVWLQWLALRLVLGGALGAGLSATPASAATAPTAVGSATCGSCHAEQARAWRASHHAQAMQVATPQTVQGDFQRALVEHHGQRTEFFRQGTRFMVRTAGADGVTRDVEATHVLGVYPLQQLLISMPGGRLQALGVAWDSRPRAQGGQRWFHLYPEAPPEPGEATHWTGREQTWNGMCAACHTTNFRKGYQAESDNYRSSWDELGAGCESCHGPGREHLAWARGSQRAARPAGLGFAQPVSRLQARVFAFLPGATRQIAQLQTPADPQQRGAQAGEVCAGCHARRSELVDAPDPTQPFLDQHLPSLVAPELFHSDGRIDGEVFEWGAFAQSAMHRAGVSCSNCHDSHSLQLRAPGNALCSQCHLPSSYDRPEHHRHAPESAGAQCVSCHMPTRTYMGVHVRHDHSLRVPAPNNNGTTPDACGACHADRPAGWTQQALQRWTLGRATPLLPAYAAEFTAAWQAGRIDARQPVPMLRALAAESAFIRASAWSTPQAAWTLPALRAAAADADALVRVGAARALARLSAADPAQALAVGVPLLSDARRAVRVEALRSLLPIAASQWPPASRAARDAALAELIAAETHATDRPEARVNLAWIHAQTGDAAAAEQQLRLALKQAPDFVPAAVNLADLLRQRGRDAEGQAPLQQALQRSPRSVAAAHALGLWMVRAGRLNDAVPLFERASQGAPERPVYALLWALALGETGQVAAALQVLDAALTRHPSDAALQQARRQWALRLPVAQ